VRNLENIVEFKLSINSQKEVFLSTPAQFSSEELNVLFLL